MPYFVYVLKSKSTGKSYIGHSKDLNNRVTEHNNGKNQATRRKGPWMLMYQEEFLTRTDAMRREKHFKTQIGRIELKKRGLI
jgi:putative endonuclease